MKQSRTMSMVEAVANIIIGFGINFVVNITLLRALGFNVTPSDAFNIGLIFTLISIIRSFVMRRVFEAVRIWQQGVVS